MQVKANITASSLPAYKIQYFYILPYIYYMYSLYMYYISIPYILVKQLIVLLPSVKLQLVLMHAHDTIKDLTVIETRCKKPQINHFPE